ncbi:MAG TPA: thioredoxin domain-containing protein, partial [Solirubrobacterales bacterium]|nr:thioredoxin domain-containing protein [Solirubrobacterales bacterium]
MRRRLTLALALVAGLAVIVVVAGCGSSSGGSTTPPPNYKKALKGAPQPLAKLYGEANKLLPGGKEAFEARVKKLGYPVVANVWASWCGPCRLEFPIFQQVSAKWGKKVAFLG